MPTVSRSFLSICLHAILGRPLFLFPSACQLIAVLSSLSGCILSTCPVYFILLSVISSTSGRVSVVWYTSSFVMRSLKVILRIFLRHRCWKTFSFFFIFTVIFQVSLVYRTIGKTIVCKSLTFKGSQRSGKSQGTETQSGKSQGILYLVREIEIFT